MIPWQKKTTFYKQEQSFILFYSPQKVDMQMIMRDQSVRKKAYDVSWRVTELLLLSYEKWERCSLGPVVMI